MFTSFTRFFAQFSPNGAGCHCDAKKPQRTVKSVLPRSCVCGILTGERT